MNQDVSSVNEKLDLLIAKVDALDKKVNDVSIKSDRMLTLGKNFLNKGEE
jgi:uncharacterized protein YlxW (UPF0749 family)